MLNMILGMLALVTSKKFIVAKLSEASNNYLNASSEEEKQSTLIKLIAVVLLFGKKIERIVNPEMPKLVAKELQSINEEVKEKIDDAEEQDEIISEIAETIGITTSDEEDDDEFHVHDCDAYAGKGQCPIEEIMRDVKAGKLTPEEGEKAVREITDNIENGSEESAPLSHVVAEA